MILYHASYCRIDIFEIPANGLHLGSIKSALEAGLRKAYQKGTDVYLHKVDCKVCKVYSFAEDLGEDWSEAISLLGNEKFCWIRYSNKYEPSIHDSWITIDNGSVRILEVSKFSTQEVEEMLEDINEVLDLR